MPTITKAIRTGYETRIVWTQDSQSIPNNTTTVTAKVQLVSTGSSYTINSTASKSGTLTINGTSYSFTFSAALSGNQVKTLYSKTVIVPHNADGTKTCSFSAAVGINVTLSGTYYGTINISGSGAFTTIPRASSIAVSPSPVTMGNDLTITISRASSSFTHKLTYVFGDKSGTIATSATTSATWTVPLNLAEAVPNSTSGTGTLTCETFSGSTSIGKKSISFTTSVPSSVVPTISNVAVSEAVEGIATQFNGFVQNKSKLSVAITAAGAYNSTITQYKSYIQSVEYYGASFTSNLITVSGSFSLLTIVTDSRGRTAQLTTPLTAIAYSPPAITAFSGFRCNSDGTENYEGQYLNLNINFQIAPANNLNTKSHKVEYKLKSASTWTELFNSSVYSYNGNIVTTSTFNVDNAFDVRLTVTDFFGSVVSLIDIPTAFTLLDCRSTGKGIAFGKVSEADRMEIALDVELTGTLLQESIQTPTLQNSWVNYGAAYQGAGYWKDKCGVVHLCGLIKSGTTTAETVIFTLPAGYRPAISEKFFAVSLNAICVIDVYATGNVAIKTGANAGWLSLSGISFKAGN